MLVQMLMPGQKKGLMQIFFIWNTTFETTFSLRGIIISSIFIPIVTHLPNRELGRHRGDGVMGKTLV